MVTALLLVACVPAPPHHRRRVYPSRRRPRRRPLRPPPPRPAVRQLRRLLYRHERHEFRSTRRSTMNLAVFSSFTTSTRRWCALRALTSARSNPGLAEKWETKDSGDRWDLTFIASVRAPNSPMETRSQPTMWYTRSNGCSRSTSRQRFLFSDIAQLKPDGVKAMDPRTVVISLPKTASPQDSSPS